MRRYRVRKKDSRLVHYLYIPREYEYLWKYLTNSTVPKDRENGRNTRVLSALALVYGADPEQREQAVLSLYREGELISPDPLPDNWDFGDVLQAELRHCSLFHLMDKWFLTKEQLAATIFWYLVRNG